MGKNEAVAGCFREDRRKEQDDGSSSGRMNKAR